MSFLYIHANSKCAHRHVFSNKMHTNVYTRRLKSEGKIRFSHAIEIRILLQMMKL